LDVQLDGDDMGLPCGSQNVFRLPQRLRQPESGRDFSNFLQNVLIRYHPYHPHRLFHAPPFARLAGLNPARRGFQAV
jgi:hypothetical protein